LLVRAINGGESHHDCSDHMHHQEQGTREDQRTRKCFAAVGIIGKGTVGPLVPRF